MKKEGLVIFLIFLLALLVYRDSFVNFFAQDDFILIDQFSQNGLSVDLKNTFNKPTVTHWRPVHNLFFLIAGNLFGKNYVFYHILIFFVHIGISFLIYKIINKINKNFWASVTSSIVYAIHPAHFVSLFWISGSATSIGIFLFLFSFYFYLKKRTALSLFFWTVSLLASEAMVMGYAILISYALLFKNRPVNKYFRNAFLILALFVVIKFLITPKTTYEIYRFELNKNVIFAIKYYILRIVGFAGVSGDFLISLILVVWLMLLLVFILRTLARRQLLGDMAWAISIIILGLFPFILIPEHLSAHYMNISVLGFGIIIGFVIAKITNKMVRIAMVLIFVVISLINVNLISQNNWVLARSNLAKYYLGSIKSSNFENGSTIVFRDTSTSTSKETYISLGGEKAINFWFKEKNYKTCFTFDEKCPDRAIKIIF